MTTSTTESTVRRHVDAFVQRRGVAAIVRDYDDDARLHSETQTYRGKKQISGFFTDPIASLPPGAVENFALRKLVFDGELAYITWCAGPGVPLGTDTFVVRDGRIVSQTVAICAASAA